jgi:hypothetical protein
MFRSGPRTYTVSGATGREYTVEVWLPPFRAAPYLRLATEFQALAPAERDARVDLQAAILDEAQRLALAVLYHSDPNVVMADVRADFPGESLLLFLAHHAQRWAASVEEFAHVFHARVQEITRGQQRSEGGS